MKLSEMQIGTLAAHIGVSYQAIKKLLDGGSKMLNAENNVKAAHALGVSSEWLATGKGPMVERQDARELARRFDSLPMETMQQLYMRQSTYVQCMAAIAAAAGLPQLPTEASPPADPQPIALPRPRPKTRT